MKLLALAQDRQLLPLLAEYMSENQYINHTVAYPDGEVVPFDQQTEEEQHYAKIGGCVWKTINGKRVCIVPRGTLFERGQRALRSFKPATKEKQDKGFMGAQKIALMLKTHQTPDQDPMDLVVRIGERTHAVEVKTFVDNSNDKVTMHPESLFRKLAWGKRNSAILHTVVVDSRKGAISSGHDVWYRRGVGSFRLGTMIRVRSSAHLKELMTTSAGLGESY